MTFASYPQMAHLTNIALASHHLVTNTTNLPPCTSYAVDVVPNVFGIICAFTNHARVFLARPSTAHSITPVTLAYRWCVLTELFG